MSQRGQLKIHTHLMHNNMNKITTTNGNITITTRGDDNSYNDKNGNNLNHYKKLFPIGSKFIYKTKYGGRLELIVDGITHMTISSRTSEYSSKYSIITNLSDDIENPYRIVYEVENCVSLIRKNKLKRLIEDEDIIE